MLSDSFLTNSITVTNDCSKKSIPPASRYAQDFIELGRIGKGGYGNIYMASHKLDSVRYALKKIEWQEPLCKSLNTSPVFMKHNIKKSDMWKILVREVHSLSSLNHVNICRYFQAWIEEQPAQRLSSKNISYGLLSDITTENEEMSIEFENSQGHPNQLCLVERGSPKKEYRRRRFTLYIQMQLYEKNLRDWLDTPNHELNHRENMNIFRQITEGLEYIHQRGIVHRDLKPENIFLTQGPSGTTLVCIGDFGLAATTSELLEEVNSQRIDFTNGVGTLTYASPEQLKCQKYNEKTDIYSLGIILFELFTYFKTKMERAVVLKELRTFIFPPPFLQKYPQETALIMRLMSLTADHRPSASEILRSEVVYGYEPCVATPKKELEAMKLKIQNQEEIIQQQEAIIQKLCALHETVNQLSLSPRKQVKRRLWDDKENLEIAVGSPLSISALKSQKSQIAPFVN